MGKKLMETPIVWFFAHSKSTSQPRLAGKLIFQMTVVFEAEVSIGNQGGMKH